jgi:hypothetical protein
MLTSTVNGQGVHGQRAPRVSLGTRLTGGPLELGLAKEKEKGSGWFWAQMRWAGLVSPTRLGSARGSAWSAARQAGFGRWAGWLVLALMLLGPQWAGGPLLLLFSSSLAGCFFPLPSC